MQKRLTEAVLEGEREGQKRPPPRCQGPRPPTAQKHAGSAGMLGHLAVSRPTPCEFGRNEGVRGPSGNRGSQGSHPCGGWFSPVCGRLEGRGPCRLWRGGQWSPGGPAGCCSHTGPAGREGQQACGWSSGAGVAEGTPRLQDSLPGGTSCRGMRPVCSAQCGPRQPRAAAETLNAQLCFL